MICPYCKQPLKQFTPSFVCCFNDDCPHRKLKPNEWIAGIRGYCVEGKEGE